MTMCRPDGHPACDKKEVEFERPVVVEKEVVKEVEVEKDHLHIAAIRARMTTCSTMSANCQRRKRRSAVQADSASLPDFRGFDSRLCCA